MADTDTRPRVLTTKLIDAEGLDFELGNHGICVGADAVVVAEGSPVTQAELEAAVNAHTGQPSPEHQAQLAREADAEEGVDWFANTAGIRAKCKAVLAGTDSFTVVQRDKAIAGLVLNVLRDRSDT